MGGSRSQAGVVFFRERCRGWRRAIDVYRGEESFFFLVGVVKAKTLCLLSPSRQNSSLFALPYRFPASEIVGFVYLGTASFPD